MTETQQLKTMNRNYRMSPRNPFVGVSFVGEVMCGSNGQCTMYKCQEFISDISCYPELEREERHGFAICPKCGASYGVDAMTGEEYRRATE